MTVVPRDVRCFAPDEMKQALRCLPVDWHFPFSKLSLLDRELQIRRSVLSDAGLVW